MKKKRLLICCLGLFSLLLSGCMSSHKKDGPPPFPVDVSQIHDAVPKAEPLSRIGNKPIYTVFGKKYHVLPSRKNYAAVGIASWYGTKFDHRRTSNGEIYNMLGMTAAHRSLPLPTYVQVTNLENGRQVVVKVNDRGPFEQNRLIDLSYAAAKKLGMEGRGTALVEVKALNPEKPTRKLALMALDHKHKNKTRCYAKLCGGRFSLVYLQVGQFRQKNAALRLQQRLSKCVRHPIHIQTASQGQGLLYQVQIGPIKDRLTAEQIRQRLKSLGLTSKKVAYEL